MKVMFLISNLGSGGAERTVQYLANYLSCKGDVVTVVNIGNIKFYDITKNAKLIELNIPSIPKNILDRVKNIMLRFIKVRLTVKKERPDLIFCIMPGEIRYLIGLKKNCAFKLISSERILPEIHSKKELKSILRHYKMCDGVIFQTDRAAKFYSDLIECESKVIHNAVGNEWVYHEYPRDNIRNTISAIGRLCDQKDYVTLIQAFEIVHRVYRDYNLEIYGEGPDKAKIENLIEYLNLQNCVMLKGVCKNAIQRIADTRMFVLSSKYEGMPNALMEAMGVGLPVISTDCPNGPAELIENGINGMLVPVGDVQTLAKAIIYLIENPKKAEVMGKNARTILKTHSIETQANEYREFLHSIFGKC